MTIPLNLPTRSLDAVIVGGGPAAALQLSACESNKSRVTVISEHWGSGMSFMGDEVMQFYVEELRVDDSQNGLTDLLRAGQLQPTAEQYGRYINSMLTKSEARLLTERVVGLESAANGFRLTVSTSRGQEQAVSFSLDESARQHGSRDRLAEGAFP